MGPGRVKGKGKESNFGPAQLIANPTVDWKNAEVLFLLRIPVTPVKKRSKKDVRILFGSFSISILSREKIQECPLLPVIGAVLIENGVEEGIELIGFLFRFVRGI